MEKRNGLEKSYCIMRIREVLKEKEEKESFENALQRISNLPYEFDFYGMDIKSTLEYLYKLKYSTFSKYIEDVNLIVDLARKNYIYMDRPYDKPSYFIYLAYKYNLDSRVYM